MEESPRYTFTPLRPKAAGKDDEHLRRYLANERRLSPHNVYTLCKTVQTLRKKYPGRSPDLELANKIMDDMRARDLSDYTIKNYLYALEYWAASQGNKLKIPGKPRPCSKMPYNFTRSQADQLLAACKDIRELAIISTALGTGLRPTELINLDVEDIDLQEMRVYVRQRGQQHIKTKREDRVLISNRLADTLRQWIASRPVAAPSPALFITVSGTRFKLHGLEALFYRVARRGNMDTRVFPYRCRHTCLTQLAEGGTSSSVIQLQSRHKDSRSLDRYLHPGEDALRESLDERFRY